MNSTKQNIMVVDDTVANLKLIADILADQNYMVRPVPDGKLALSAAQAHPPDLILLDIMMPGLSGYDVCIQLKADERTRDIPVIFLSAKSDATDKVKAFSVGGLDYITKPFKAEEVIARVETHLKLRRLQKESDDKNERLEDTLRQLKTTQEQMIQREKMAALGQLIAGVAHEINTPLGAIRASISNVTKAMENSIERLPQLFGELSTQQKSDFMALVKTALSNTEHLSSREARKARKQLTKELAAQEICEAETVATTLINMRIYKNLTPFMALLKTANNTFIVQTAYQLVMQQNNSRNIVIAVERASKVVFALKTYTHFDNSGKKLKADLAQSIEVVLTLYHNHLKHGIEVSTHYEDVPEILCHPDELNQVWTNVIHNAIQAMDGRGRLDIRIDWQNRHIRVRFTDSGCGIDAAILEKIFDPFFTTKRAGEGSGLGLNMVRRIIDRHQGKIEVESCPGETTFSFLFPIET